MKNVKVENFNGAHGPVRNQFIITTSEGRFFQSYRTVIAHVGLDGKVTLDAYWNYSRTTGKYRNLFLGETKSETEKKIKSGEYRLADLN